MWLVVWNIWITFPYIGNNNPNWLIFVPLIYLWYPLVNVYITMEKHHAIDGKCHYKWWFSIVMLSYQRVNPLTYSFSLYIYTNLSKSINPSYFGVGGWPMDILLNVCIYICIMDIHGYVNGFPWALKDLFNLYLTEDITQIELRYT